MNPKPAPGSQPLHTHVDDFVSRVGSYNDTNLEYAAWVLCHFRYPAGMKLAFNQFMRHHHLYCSYNGKRYRVIGASRLGDIWLTTDFTKESGYELRIYPDEVTNFGDKP